MRLLCFSYSGGASSLYRPWGGLALPDVELLSAEYAGRWGRIREAPVESMAAMIESLAEAVAPLLDRPIALFGYSLGAVVAYELSRALRRIAGVAPAHLFVAAHAAPHLPARNSLSFLKEDQLIERLAELYGPMPAALLRDPEMRAFILRITRADLRCLDEYTHADEPLLRCPITAFGGDQDPAVRPHELDAWRDLTTGPYSSTVLPGRHFFINQHSSTIADAVFRALVAP